jgi:hypothetical protein
MSCCGGKRAELIATPPAAKAVRPDRRGPAAQLVVAFEYVGPTALTTVGPVTGKSYRFERHGARVFVDARDVRSMVAVPHLRRV